MKNIDLEEMSELTTTGINFLIRDPVYKSEKPYLLLYEPPEGFATSNIKTEKPPEVRIQEVKDKKNQFSLEEHGMEIMHIETALTREEFDDENLLKKVYLQEVGDLVRDRFKAKKVQIFEHLVRKRHPIFPIATGEDYKYNQPATIAHVDTTAAWSAAMVRRLNPPEVARELLKHRILCVNVWKPIRGPLRDWPLALCDPNTIKKSDLNPGDLVYDTYVVENNQMHFSPEQKWYYIKDQMPSEAWVFIQSYSEPDARLPGVPHSAFELPLMGEEPEPRESVEIRCLVYI